MKTLERRLHALEQHHCGPVGYEVWIGDDPMVGPDGQEMSRAEFEALFPDVVDIGGAIAREGSSHESD